MMKFKVCGAVLATLVCGAAEAADASTPIDWQLDAYAGTALSHNALGDWSIVKQHFDDGSLQPAKEDDAGTGYRVFAGFDLLKHFGLEAGYADLGEAVFETRSDGSGVIWSAGPIDDRVAITAFDLTLLGKLLLSNDLRLVAQLGALHSRTEQTTRGSMQSFGPVSQSRREKGTDPLYGLRLEYDGLPAVRLAAGYVRSSTDPVNADDTRIEMLSLSAAYRF